MYLRIIVFKRKDVKIKYYVAIKCVYLFGKNYTYFSTKLYYH